jgi:hypothetical protein
MKRTAWRNIRTGKIVNDFATRKKYYRPGLLATLLESDEQIRENTD